MGRPYYDYATPEDVEAGRVNTMGTATTPKGALLIQMHAALRQVKHVQDRLSDLRAEIEDQEHYVTQGRNTAQTMREAWAALDAQEAR